MGKDSPFIHLIKTPLSYYFYDVNTNQFVEVTKELYDYLSLEDEGQASPEIDVMVSELKKDGYLSSNRPTVMCHPASKMLAHELSHNVQQITLQLTQQCNFRCSYCIYAPSDFEIQRSHSVKRMSRETALKAVDFFAEHSENEELLAIGFYGGEPLLEFDLLKEVVLYAGELFEGKDLRFTITTNASLLTLDKIEFLKEHNFSIMVSIDGTPEIHDRGRKFASSGLGTYEKIENSLDKVKDAYPEYYHSNISFNIVIDQRFSTKTIHDFFTKNKLFRDNSVQINMIDDGNVGFEKHTVSSDFIVSERIQRFYALMKHMNRIPDVSKLAQEHLSGEIEKFKHTFIAAEKLPQETSHGGPCVPGLRLLIDTEGNLFPCERVSETSQVMLLGDLDDGLNVQKCDDILNICRLTEEDCKNCWALRQCKICARLCDDNGWLSVDLKKAQCDGVRLSIKNNFRLHLALRELNKYAMINETAP